MYVFLFALLLLLLWNLQEPFTVHIEGELGVPSLSMPNVFGAVHKYTVQPVYESIVNMIPYKHHYRKFRRYLKKM